MAFSTDEIRGLKRGIDAALRGGRLDAWQTRFLTDIKARIERYGPQTRLSAKQLAKLYECVGGADRLQDVPPSRRSGPTRPRIPRPYQRKGSRNFAREPRWFSGRFATLLVLAFIVGGAAAYHMIKPQRVYVATPSPSNIPVAVRNEAPPPSPGKVQQSPATAIIGRATVIDGDTLEIHGTRIRLYGIDAPESSQLCIVKGKKSRCGQQAALALADKIGSGTVACEAKDRDRYNRVVAVCRAGGVALNAWMVAEGWAMAYRHYSSDYVQQETSASASKIGIWQGEFIAPWDWRRGKRLAAEESQQLSGCVIKGNISRRTGERIYHVPGGAFYDRTRIDPSKGERMFCSEADARAAGWRRSRR